MSAAMTTKTEIPGLHAHLGYWLRLVSNAVSHSFARRVEAEGVTVGEWVFLRALFDAERIAPSALAERMGMTKGAISKLADRLVSKGLVKREADRDDKRGQMLALKAEGRKLVPRLARIADANDADFFGCLTRSERRQLRRILEKIVSDRGLTNVPTR